MNHISYLINLLGNKVGVELLIRNGAKIREGAIPLAASKGWKIISFEREKSALKIIISFHSFIGHG